MAKDMRVGDLVIGQVSCLDMGQLLMEKGDYANALIYLARQTVGDSTLKAPEAMDGAIALAVCRLHLRQPTAALQVCNQVLALHPNHPQALLFKGVALQRLGRYRAAYHHYRQASVPSHPTPWGWDGLKGHIKGMVRWLKVCLRRSLG